MSAITDESGQNDYPFYWSSTTHADSSGRGAFAAYIAFGRALGYMNNAWLDVHGAGAQRSDPKTGSAAEFAQGHGPQGDTVRIENYVRCVTGGNASAAAAGPASESRPSLQVQSSGLEQPTNGMQPQGGPSPMMGGTPPLEAINACSGASQGSSCSFSVPAGIVNGSCQLIQQQMACVPANRP